MFLEISSGSNRQGITTDRAGLEREGDACEVTQLRCFDNPKDMYLDQEKVELTSLLHPGLEGARVWGIFWRDPKGSS